MTTLGPLGRNTPILSWEDAPASILALALSRRALALSSRALTLSSRAMAGVVGVAGPVGAGKSTLAERLSGCIVRTDDYLPDYEDIPEHERDEPHLADAQRLASDVARLRHGEAIEAPVWSFHEHRRIGSRLIQPPPTGVVIVVEGIHALAPHVRTLLDVAVLVRAPRDDRWARWEDLERRGVRGWGVEVARSFFERVADPTFERYLPEYERVADLIVVNPGRPTPG